MVDFAAARRTMVDRQIQTMDVTDHAILAAFADVPREAFLPTSLHGIAYSDADLPLGGGRFAVAPGTLARLIQLADVAATNTVLDVAAGTGYGAAILARLAASVVALEPDAALAGQARAALEAAAAGSVVVVSAPLAEGHAAGGPYDVILVEGAAPFAPEALLAQLAPAGRLVAVVGSGLGAAATVFTRTAEGVSGRPAFNIPAPPLPGFARPRTFVF